MEFVRFYNIDHIIVSFLYIQVYIYRKIIKVKVMINFMKILPIQLRVFNYI